MKTKINKILAAAIFTILFMAGNVQAKEANLIAVNLEKIEEPAIEIENWMVNDNYWNKSDVVFFIDEISEESLELESWMIEQSSWKNQSIYNVETDTDNDLILENWMINENSWNRK